MDVGDVFDFCMGPSVTLEQYYAVMETVLITARAWKLIHRYNVYFVYNCRDCVIFVGFNEDLSLSWFF